MSVLFSVCFQANWIQKGMDHRTVTGALLRLCIIPRCLSSAADSVYCATFIKQLVLLDTQGFSFPYFIKEVRQVTTCGVNTM